jgi:hypothetical protein
MIDAARVSPYAYVADSPRFVTDKGTVVDASLAFLSTGIMPNSSFLRDGLLAPYLDAR